MSHEDFLVALQKELIEKGKLIEAGWISLRIAVIDKDASPLQLEEMRNAFFAGAQHLFASMLAVLDPGSEEPTANDLRRMELIADELQAFIDEFSKRHGLPR